MNAAEIVVKEVERHLMTVVLNFLAVTVCEPSKTAHSHPHRKIAALYETSRNVLRIGLASENTCAASNATCGAVAGLWILARGSVDFYQHRIVNIGTKGILYRFRVHAMAVRC